MKYFILIICILAFSNLAFSQTKEVEKFETEITVCPVKLLVVAANFRTSYGFSVRTGDKGTVTKVEQLGKGYVSHFIEDKGFIPCIESWKLKPLEDYSVFFSLGTSGSIRENYILISSKTEKIKIIIGVIGPELIVEDKK